LQNPVIFMRFGLGDQFLNADPAPANSRQFFFNEHKGIVQYSVKLVFRLILGDWNCCIWEVGNVDKLSYFVEYFKNYQSRSRSRLIYSWCRSAFRLPFRFHHNDVARVSSKQTKKIFESNRNKPKLNLFRLIFGLLRETNKLFFRFLSVRFGVSDPYRNKKICFETTEMNKINCAKYRKGAKNIFEVTVGLRKNTSFDTHKPYVWKK
jgi:hypothetical protein